MSNRIVIDTRTADDLASSLPDLAATVTAPGLGRAERVSRAGKAAEAAHDIRAILPTLAPYASRQHSRIADLVTCNNPIIGDGDPLAARERLDQDAQHRSLAVQLRAWPNLDPFTDATAGPVRLSPYPVATPFLDTYATPKTEELGVAQMVPDAWELPEAVIDAPMGDEHHAERLTVTGTRQPWHTSSILLSASSQQFDNTATAFDAEAAMATVASIGLERQLLADLATDAPTAATFAAAEEGAGIWPAGADLIVCHPKDKPKIVRSYAAEGIDPADRPSILATGGATRGIALVMATGAVWAEASGTEFMSVDEPSTFGKTIAAYRYGRAHLRMAGAVQLVHVAPGPFTADTPTITGTPTVAETLTADPGTWTPAAAGIVFTYQWNRDGDPIDDATDPTYTLTASDEDTHVTVTVTGTLAGYGSLVATSEPHGPVSA
ncbi:hypothetical protein [Aestuariimicrobium sp. Y1814]|uniref:hypothetical protein n=1 Tax=Aestuariimicrobium sp. Y1814 TaxID=3418742 RepID=UPI003DA75B6C